MNTQFITLESSGYPHGFITQLEQAAGSGQGALVMLAIDNLPMMISGYGFSIVEKFLQELSEIIRAELPDGCALVRVQRDQFAFILSGALSEQKHTLCAHLEGVIRKSSKNSAVGSLYCIPRAVAVGFGDMSGEAAQTFEIFSRATALINDLQDDIAAEYEAEMDIPTLSRQHLETANMLTAAMDENRLKLAFQPIIESKTGKIVHYEALLRLYSRDGKISSAGILIPIAERMGLVHLLDELTLEMVVREMRADPDVMIAFNVSNHTTRSPSWMAKFKQYLKETPEISARMICEITETAAHRDLTHVSHFCAEVQGLGAWVALDDFGSGYTSFRQLKALPVDIVKIDGAFIKDLTDNADNRFFVKTLLDFTQGFGLKSVAEFVENGETAKMLMELGVDYLQGYYFGKPENIRRWLKQGEYSRG
jgi:EAL domain-containing protein (putative c-di-GMP-specific phosphodiesterase class I)/GGDEF domain-containing protein